MSLGPFNGTANGAPLGNITGRPELVWGAPTAAERGPVIATLRNPKHRNAVGSHAGGYSVYRALAIAAKTLASDHMADLTDTAPAEHIGPHPQWLDPKKIVSLDPVWYLPGIAERFGLWESDLRHGLHEQTGGMYPELVTRTDLKVFLPPIGGTTIYCFGDPSKFGDGKTPLACRVHDECNGSDVFGSDICTCRPYLVHGIEICIQMAQAGGIGLVVYNRKEGRALGEVTKFLVYNARKRQKGGDRPEGYFKRTECVAGVQDMRFQELMPDVLHWLGITRIHRFASMSDMKCDALIRQGITIDERVSIPDELIPPDARVEIEAKIAAGYFAGDRPRRGAPDAVGRGLDE
jgi:GTP cyclohydrolase II